MNRATESAPSVQRRLLWFLLPPLALLMLAGVYANYRAATAFVESAYDQRLGDAAVSLAGSLIRDGQRLRVDPSVVPATAHRADHLVSLRYAIVTASGELLAGSREVPAASASLTTNPTFADAIVGGERLRVASYRVDLNRDTVVISVAESASQRAVPGRFILASTWLMDFIQLDVTLLIVWLGVYFALKPLLSLRRQIEAGSPRELNHLDSTTVPAEVKPLVEALNLLFDVLAEAARSQRRFVADTAHQLRTPIAGLLGNLELLMKEPGAAALRPRLEALHAGMENLARSANQLLALARADPSTSFAEQFDSVDLRALAGRMVESNVDRALHAGLDLGVEAAAVAVRGNVRLLEDLLGNLVDNAIHYTPGGGHVTVRAGLRDGRPFLEVEDDGPGIPEDQRGRVRERFYRIPGTAGHGCGLGLAIVSEIAEAHGAQFTLESGAAGRGTRARLLFQSPVNPIQV
ncbi:MAG TPA: sensor histidine kinase [Steroidobacteraceae bacterium]|nr:sensor histidine kinase [Steroidobacteraceae bacterium]